MTAAIGTWGGWTALTAIGTVGAVVVAVGLQGWMSWRERTRRPKLSLAFDSHMRVDEADRARNAVPCLRLAVANEAGKETARGVEILILQVEEYATSFAGSSGRRIWLANPALGWANSVDPRPRMAIPPGATRYAEIGSWMQVELAAEMNPRLSVVPEPNSNRHLLPPGGWRLRLVVTTRNADATFWDADVSFESAVSQGIATLENLTARVAIAKS